MKKTNKDADLSLVRRVKKGDYRSFDLLVLKYQSRVIALSNKYVHDYHLAEDIAQEAFIKAFKSIHSFREESAFYTWLYRIAANTCKNYLSSKKRSKEKSESEMLSAGQDKLSFLLQGFLLENQLQEYLNNLIYLVLQITFQIQIVLLISSLKINNSYRY